VTLCDRIGMRLTVHSMAVDVGIPRPVCDRASIAPACNEHLSVSEPTKQ